MEEGSLLEDVLLRGQRQDIDPSINVDNKNLLLLDVYLLEVGQDRIQHLLSLARLARQGNQFLQSKQYNWHYGGDGPVFGINVCPEGIPHLRAYCRYGPNVSDEWMAVDFMIQMSRSMYQENIAVSCWDVEDGQVILIQTANVLPKWLDEDPTDKHRHACWIRNGQIYLLRRPHISIKEALQELGHRGSTSCIDTIVQKSLLKWLEINRTYALKNQRTPFVVPRKIAHLMRKRPDLVQSAIQEFCSNIDLPPPDLSKYEDWVWTVHELSRTNYAMVRTMVSTEWSQDLLPSVGVEVKRFRRKCAIESAPHLKHALQLGVRLVAGFEFLSSCQFETVSTDGRIAHWCRVDEESQGSMKQAANWLLESYQRGPKHAYFNLEDILKCPVFPEESKNGTIYSYPDVSIKQQLLNAQKGADENQDFPMPKAEHVDDDDWLELKSGETIQNNDLDTMLSKFQNFMVQPSDLEGVYSSFPEEEPTRIRPRILMNILCAVLKGEEIVFPSCDPFFYEEDYDLLAPDQANEESEDVREMQGLMDAMDDELERTTKSRDLDRMGEDGLCLGNDRLEESTHVLKNLLSSLEASAGVPGPVPNMLKEMGEELPI